MDLAYVPQPSTLDLLIDLAAIGVSLRAQDDTLLVTPASHVGRVFQERIRAAKPDLMLLLSLDREASTIRTPAQHCHAIFWWYAWHLGAELVSREENAPDEMCLQAARSMVDGIKEQIAKGYFPGGRLTLIDGKG